MNARPATTRSTWAAAIAAVAGPTYAFLVQTDHLRPFESHAIVDIWVVAAIGAIGVGMGIYAFCKGSKIAGTVCFLTNVPALAFYGFITFFFAMGGSR